MPTSNCLTVRLSNLPPETIPNDARRFFDGRIGPSGTVVSKNGVGQIITEVNRRTKQTIVTLSSLELKRKAIEECNGTAFSAEHGNGSLIVDIDDHFNGLTTLYAPENGLANLDIVALHGLSGHAWHTFASTHNSREGIKETSWLRDELPRFLEQQEGKELRPRVMTFGYQANVWINATADGLDTPVADLIHSLKVERQQYPDRPLIFIGHSLGGIIIKQVADEMITTNKQNDPNFSSPIKACLFLAVPHRGTGNADFYGAFLTTLKKFLLPGMGPNRRFVQDLERKNKKLADITDRFIQLLNGNRISIISCYENRDYAKGKGKIVSKESATLDYSNRQQLPRPIDANHSDVARFGSASQHPFVEIATELAEIGYSAILDLGLRLSALKITGNAHDRENLYTTQGTSITAEPRQPGVEPAYFKLTRYTTIFLVDDSTSMEDIPEINQWPWKETTAAIADCAKLILGAGGRLKIHFFNSPKSRENVSGVEDVKKLCREVIPRGDTPTYQRLKRHLDEFIDAFKPLSAKGREDYPGLNLIMFTDGAPEVPFADIEEIIVETAQDLDECRADKYKLGIQFVQIGDDEAVTKFFDRIDNEIKGEHHLRRDIIDTVRYNRETANNETYKKIVLGAIDKHLDEEIIVVAPHPHSSSQPRFTPSLGQNGTRPNSSSSDHRYENHRNGTFVFGQQTL